MNCPYCNSDKTKIFLSAKCLNYDSGSVQKELLGKIKEMNLTIILCLNCGLGYNSNPYSEEDMRFIYENYNPVTVRQSEVRKPLYDGMFSLLCRYLQFNDKIVEIGCSDGYLLDLLKNTGYTDCIGIEPGPMGKEARNTGLNIINDYYHPDTFISNDVDAFFLMHVFEHFSNPFTIMKSMKKQLKKHGVIILEVPYFCYFIHQHLYYYNIHFLTNLSHDLGLKIAEFQIQGSPYLTGSVLRMVFVHEENTEVVSLQFQESIQSLRALTTQRQKEYFARYKKLKKFIRGSAGCDLYWWGAGGVSAPALYAAISELKECNTVYVIDSSSKKWNQRMPGTVYSVHPDTILWGKKIDNLVIASDYYADILDSMKRNNINALNIFVVTVADEFRIKN